MPTRRELLLGPGKPPPTDGELIAVLASLELLTGYVYRRGLASGRLGPHLQALATEIEAHERAHAAALAAQLPALGATSASVPGGDRDAEAALSLHHVEVVFAELDSAHQWAHLFAETEEVLERNYHLAISLLRRKKLLRLAASIVANEAQHSVVLAEFQHPGDIKKTIPTAFVNGT